MRRLCSLETPKDAHVSHFLLLEAALTPLSEALKASAHLCVQRLGERHRAPDLIDAEPQVLPCEAPLFKVCIGAGEASAAHPCITANPASLVPGEDHRR